MIVNAFMPEVYLDCPGIAGRGHCGAGGWISNNCTGRTHMWHGEGREDTEAFLAMAYPTMWLTGLTSEEQIPILASYFMNSEVDSTSEIQSLHSLNEITNSLNLVCLSCCVFSLCALSIPDPSSPDADLSDDPHMGCTPPVVLSMCFVSLLLSFFRLFWEPFATALSRTPHFNCSYSGA